MFATLRDFGLDHIVSVASGLGIIGLVLLCVFVPALLPAILSLLRQKITWIVAAILLAAVGGWEARSAFDDGVAARKALAIEQAHAKDLEAQASELQRRADATAAIATAANQRTAQAQADSQTLTQEIEAYEQELARRDAAQKSVDGRSCGYGHDDVERLRRIAGFAADRAKKHAAGPAGASR